MISDFVLAQQLPALSNVIVIIFSVGLIKASARAASSANGVNSLCVIEANIDVTRRVMIRQVDEPKTR